MVTQSEGEVSNFILNKPAISRFWGSPVLPYLNEPA